MRISDWSSDVCSSDLGSAAVVPGGVPEAACSAANEKVRPPRGAESLLPSLVEFCLGGRADPIARRSDRSISPRIVEGRLCGGDGAPAVAGCSNIRSEEHKSELQ